MVTVVQAKKDAKLRRIQMHRAEQQRLEVSIIRIVLLAIAIPSCNVYNVVDMMSSPLLLRGVTPTVPQLQSLLKRIEHFSFVDFATFTV